MRSINWFSSGKPTRTAIAVTCAQAFFLFGYDQGVFGGLITNSNFLDTFGRPAPGLLGIIVSIYNLGCLFGCALNFIWGERLGRRWAIMSAMLFVSLGAVIQASSYGVPQLMIGRFITGIGVGVDSSTVPMYQVELCRQEGRGRLVSMEVCIWSVR
jgi:MFS family permease